MKMLNKLIVVSLVAAGIIGLSCPSSATEMGEIQLHGFVSQGFLKSTSHNYLGNSHDGSLEFNEIGVNFTLPVSDELRFGFQLFSRDLGDIGNNLLTVDWAFIDYQLKDEFGIRLGKIKTPFGLYNRQRDADMLRTPVLLNQSVYQEDIRDFIVAFQGTSIYGTLKTERFGYLEYEVFGGNCESDMNPYLSMNMSRLAGGMLMWNSPVPGLRCGGSTFRGEGSADMMGFSFDVSIDGANVLYLSQEVGNFLFSTEYFTNKGEFTSDVLGTFPINFLGFYGIAGYQVMDWLEVAVSYSEHYQDAD